jgi:hypothetical protein
MLTEDGRPLPVADGTGGVRGYVTVQLITRTLSSRHDEAVA